MSVASQFLTELFLKIAHFFWVPPRALLVWLKLKSLEPVLDSLEIMQPENDMKPVLLLFGKSHLFCAQTHNRQTDTSNFEVDVAD